MFSEVLFCTGDFNGKVLILELIQTMFKATFNFTILFSAMNHTRRFITSIKVPASRWNHRNFVFQHNQSAKFEANNEPGQKCHWLMRAKKKPTQNTIQACLEAHRIALALQTR